MNDKLFTIELIKRIPKTKNYQGVKNQFIIYCDEYTLFQSYSSPIALKMNGKIYLFENWDYLKTTGKYRNMFLGETKKETLKKLKTKEYIAVDFEVEQ